MRNFKYLLMFFLVFGIITSGIQDLKDDRPEKIEAFLSNYPNNPIREHANYIVKTADEFGLDYRLYVALAGAESTFGKNYPKHTKNLTGYNSCNTSFTSINHNIYRTYETIAKTKYYKKYRKTKKIEDLVYVYKGVPPFKKYVNTVNYIFNKIDTALSPSNILMAQENKMVKEEIKKKPVLIAKNTLTPKKRTFTKKKSEVKTALQNKEKQKEISTAKAPKEEKINSDVFAFEGLRFDQYTARRQISVKQAPQIFPD